MSMSDFADFFDAEMSQPTLIIKEAKKYPGVWNAFKNTTREAGPMLAGFGAVPDVMEGIGSLKGLKQVAKDKKALKPILDEMGNVVKSVEEQAAELKAEKKKLTGGVIASPMKTMFNLGTWALPEVKLPAMLAMQFGGDKAIDLASRAAGNVLG